MINPNRFRQRVSHDRYESLTFPGSAHEKVTEKWTATTRQNKVGGACDSMVMMASFEMSASVCDQPVLDRMSLLRIRPVIKRSLVIGVIVPPRSATARFHGSVSRGGETGLTTRWSRKCRYKLRYEYIQSAGKYA
jgi:hypothetical protein